MTTTRKALAALGLLIVLAAPPARLHAQGPGEVVSVPVRQFRLKGLARWGLDLLFEERGRVFIAASSDDIAALARARVAFAFGAPLAMAASKPAGRRREGKPLHHYSQETAHAL